MNSTQLSILYVLVAGFFFSVTDISVKYFTTLMPLHEVVFFRSIIALIFTLSILLPFDGGWSSLRASRPSLHILRGFCLVIANLTFFSGLAVIPLAESTAIFFVAPLMITFISVIFLREDVGYRRWFALIIGLIGVLLIIKPGTIKFEWVVFLPLAAALAYAFNNVLARKMGLSEKAITMAFYVHVTFIIVCSSMGIAFGKGQFSGSENLAWEFIFRPWKIPDKEMIYIIFAAGLGSAFGGYFISQAYRLSSASIVAPFEYCTLVLAVFWGFTLWGELPDSYAFFGIMLIISSGVFIAIREIKKDRSPSISKILGKQ